MDLGSPELWRWIWLGAAVVLGLGELSMAGSFFLLPFAIGAAVAAIFAFLTLGVGLEWVVFLVVSGGSFAALYPVGRRLDRSIPLSRSGADRLVGQVGQVINAIPAGPSASGDVRVESETWRSRSVDDSAIAQGATVDILRIEGTHLIVAGRATESGNGEL